MNAFRSNLFALFAIPTSAIADDWSISGSFETTLWLSDDVPAAFLEFDDGAFIDPRLSVSFDYSSDPRFFFHATLRADRGFDPGAEPDGDIRLDELSLLYRPDGTNALNLQLGKFPTVVGNWVPTHNYYEDPFLLPPLPYSAINGVNLNNPANNSPTAIQTRSNVSGSTIHSFKENWASIIWGPAYSNGFSVFGSSERFDYAFEIRNASLGAQPSEWDIGEGDFSTPTLSARLGYRPDAAWALGISASYGHYLNPGAEDVLGPGSDREDFTQTLLGLDLRWAHRGWIVSGEAFFTQYKTLHEDFRSFSYYLQSRYKIAPGLWFAARFGQTRSNEVSIPSGGQTSWSPDITRAELGLGWRITRDTLIKAQYAHTDITNNVSTPAEDLFAFSFGWRF